MGSNRPAARNQRAKLAADLNDLFKDLQSNQVKVVGNYHLGQLIGQGTYGKVKLATHALTGQQVAVKIVAKAHAAIITREIYHWRCLTHANIAHLHEVLTTESKIYLVTEYCPNGELLEALIRDGKCKPSLAKKWFRQICLALQYCHAKKIVHRDLKLENILLDSQDNIKLIDFGFTRECESKKLLESYCGSAAYTAPEIIVGKKYSGPEADIWSLGVILYTLLAGYLPFDDDNESVVQDKIVDLDYDMPNELFCTDAQDLIKSILKEEPTERFSIDQILSHPWWASGDDDCEEAPAAMNGTQNEDNTTQHARQGSLTKREIHPVHSSQNGPEVVYGSSPQFVSPLAQYPFNPWGNQSPYALNPTSDALRAAYPGGPSNPSPIASPLPSPSPMVNKSFPRHESGADNIQGSRSPSAGAFPATGFEQRLMTLLGRIGFDQEIFTKGVPNQSCDPGYGLWCLLVDQIRQRAIDNGTSLEWEQSIAYIDAASLLGHGALNGASSSALMTTTMENGKRSPRPMSDPSPTSSQTNLLLPQASLHQQQAQLQAHQDLQQQTADLKQQLDQYKLEVELFKVEKQLLEKQKQCLEESQASTQTYQHVENKELPPIYAQDVSTTEQHSSSKGDRPVQDSGVSVSTNSTPHSSWELTEREGPIISTERPRRKSKGILHSLKDRFFHSASDSEHQHHFSGSNSPYPPSPAPAKHFAGSTASASSSASSATTYATSMTPKPLPAPPAHPYPHPHPHLLQQPATHSPLSIVSYKSASTSSLAMDTGHATGLPIASRSAASTDHLAFEDQSLESDSTSAAPKRGGFMTWITESASGTVLNKSPVIHSSAKVPKRLNTKSFSGAETFPLPSTGTKSSASSLEEARPQIPAIPASFFQPMWKASGTHGSSASLTASNAGPSTSTLATSAPSMSIRQRLASFSSSSAKITPEERQRAAAAAAAAVALVAAPAPPERAHSPSPPSSPRGSGGSSAFGVLGSAKSKKERHQQDEISDIVAAAVAATASAHLQSSGSRKKTSGMSGSSSKKTKSEKSSKARGGSSNASEAAVQGSSRHVRQPSESSWKSSAPSLQIPSPPMTGAQMDDLAPSAFSLTAKDAARKPSIKASKATMPSLMTAFSSFKPSRSAPSSPVVQQPIQQLKQTDPSVETRTRRRDSRSSRHDEPSNLARVMSNSSSRSSAATTPTSATPTTSMRTSQEKRMSSSGIIPAIFDKESDQSLRKFDDGVVIQEEVRPKKRTTSRTSITAASLGRKSNESVVSSLDRSEPSSPYGTTSSPMGPSKRTSHGSLGSRRSSSSSMRDRNIFGLTLENTGSGSKKSSLSLSRTSLSKSTFQSPTGSPVHARRGIDMDRERGGHGHISRSSNDEGRPSPRSIIISAAEMAGGSNVDRVYESLRRESGHHRRSESIPENRVVEAEDTLPSHPSPLTLQQQRGGPHGSSNSGASDHNFSRQEALSTSDRDNNTMLVASATAATITPSLSASSSLNQVEATDKDEENRASKDHDPVKEEDVQVEDEDPLFSSDAPRLDFADGCSLIPSPPPSPAPHLSESGRGSGLMATRDIGPRMERDLSMLEEPKVNLLSTSYPPPRTSLSYTPASTSISEDMDTLAAHQQDATSPPSPSRPLVSFDQHFSNQVKIKEYRDSTPRKVVNGFQPLAAKRLSKPGLANNSSNTTNAGDAPAVPGLPSATGHLAASSLAVANGPPNAFAGRRRGYRNSTGSMANMTLQQQQTFQQLQKEQLMKIQQNQPNAGYEATAAMKIHPRPRTGLFPKREYTGGALGGLGGLGGAGVPSGLGNSNNGGQGGFDHSYDTNMGNGGGVGGKRDSYSSRRQSMAVAMGKRPGAAPAVIQEEEE